MEQVANKTNSLRFFIVCPVHLPRRSSACGARTTTLFILWCNVRKHARMYVFHVRDACRACNVVHLCMLCVLSLCLCGARVRSVSARALVRALACLRDHTCVCFHRVSFVVCVRVHKNAVDVAVVVLRSKTVLERQMLHWHFVYTKERR